MPKKKFKSIQKRGIHRQSNYFEEFEKFSRKIHLKIAELRATQGLTQEQMQDFELNLRQFQRIEAGDTKNITLSNLFKLAKAFGLEPYQLLKV